MRGTWGPVTRTVVAGRDYVLDVVELNAPTERLLELPWHLDGATVLSPGTWEPDSVGSRYVTDVERFVPASADAIAVRAEDASGTLTIHFDPGASLLRGRCPPAPTARARRTFLMRRLRGSGAQLVAVVGFRPDAVRALRVSGTSIEVETDAGSELHAATSEGWSVRSGGDMTRLGGMRAAEPDFEPLVTRIRVLREHATVPFAGQVPALDGTGEGFERGGVLRLDHEDQYRRSEDPYAGPDAFSASARLLWDDEALYLAVDVIKPELIFRPAGAAPLRFDNEVDDIHSDGLQVYLRGGDGQVWGALIVPEENGVRVQPVAETIASAADVQGGWSETSTGYRVTVAIAPSFWDEAHAARSVDFDLIVNEMREGRERRAGQLVWSGGGGWIWLRGNSQAPERFGVLELT